MLSPDATSGNPVNPKICTGKDGNLAGVPAPCIFADFMGHTLACVGKLAKESPSGPPAFSPVRLEGAGNRILSI